MVSFAITSAGEPVYPEKFSETEWLALKDSYQVGDFLMPCCTSPAVPKTSINGIQFFSHLADECKTSPESQWHIATKDKVVRGLSQLGITAHLEHPTHGSSGRIKSDVFFKWGERKIAIEVQHSYQTLNEYLRRQKKYDSEGIENYWLIYKPRYLTLCKSIGRLRIRRDFGNQFPPEGFFPVLPELPIALYIPEIDDGIVTGGSPLRAPLIEWLTGLLTKGFRYTDGAWRLT